MGKIPQAKAGRNPTERSENGDKAARVGEKSNQVEYTSPLSVQFYYAFYRQDASLLFFGGSRRPLFFKPVIGWCVCI